MFNVNRFFILPTMQRALAEFWSSTVRKHWFGNGNSIVTIHCAIFLVIYYLFKITTFCIGLTCQKNYANENSKIPKKELRHRALCFMGSSYT